MFFFYFMEYYMNLILLLLLSVVLFTLSGCREAVSGVPEAPPRPAAVTDLPLGIIGRNRGGFIWTVSRLLSRRGSTPARPPVPSMPARSALSSATARSGVRFLVVNRTSQEKRNYELPVARTVQIKRHEAESTTRLSVMLTFRIGHLTLEQEFTLADREKFEYPVLLGRNVISGLAAVDPSRHNTL